MESSIRSRIFVHDLRNPPAEDRSCDFEIRIVNSKGLIDLEKQAVGLQTEYSLKIQDTKRLGLASVNEQDPRQIVKDVVLASNLILQRACVSTMKGDLSQSELQIKPPEIPAKVEQTAKAVSVTMTDTVVVKESIHITMKTEEELDEEQTISNLRLLRRLNRYTVSEKVAMPVSNLSKALSEFESAMTVFPRLMIFKHLFNALELSTNSDGIDRTADSLDKEVSRISRVSVVDVEKWRDFYNRTKHIDKSSKHVTEFVTGIETLPMILVPLRRASAVVTIDRLSRLT